jgi:hypothetical protein
MQKHTCMAGWRLSTLAAVIGRSEFKRCCAPYLVARRYYHPTAVSRAASLFAAVEASVA